MAVSRRRFISTAASGMALAPLSAATLPPILAEDPAQQTAAVLPPLEIIALNRMGYGPRPGDVAAFRQLGATPDAQFAAYVEQQLNPAAIDDSACEAKIAATRLKITYDADSKGRYPALNEARALTKLSQTIYQLWPLTDYNQAMSWSERMRGFDEVRVATWLRAVYSRRQLQEVLVDFWHNHFNVNASAEVEIAASLPVYDRDVIRKNCLGNFRTFLETVGRSAAMMYALDNYNNKVGGGEGSNENYARELFELHTLSSDNYLKFYDDYSMVGTITYNGKQYQRGYLDKDVYEAAVCLTGWTIDDDNASAGRGAFRFNPSWHYSGIKRVLGTIIEYDADVPLADGQKVFELLAAHPGTARALCTKLCRRLISDTPPTAVIDAAVDTWMSNLTQPDQIKRVVRVILLSDAFKTTWGEKIKRPFDAIVSYLRATNATLPSDIVDATDKGKGGYWSSIFWNVQSTGHKLFEWPTPTGHPDVATYWINTNSTLRRWNLPFVLAQSWGGNIVVPVVEETNLNLTCTQIVDYWINRLCGFTIDSAARNELIAFLAYGGNPNAPPAPTAKSPDWGNQDGLKDRLRAMVQLLAAAPDFHAR